MTQPRPMTFEALVTDLARQIVEQIDTNSDTVAGRATVSRFLSTQYALFPEISSPAETMALQLVDVRRRDRLARCILTASIAHARQDDETEKLQ